MPTDPIAKKQKAAEGKRPAAEILAVKMKQGIGQIGVELHYYLPPDYYKLKDEQKKELKDWWATSEGKAAMIKDNSDLRD